VVSWARNNAFSTVVIIEAHQVLLNLDEVLSGIASIRKKDVDYFTQYEFSRLPLGVGARAIALKHPDIRSWDGGLSELQKHIRKNPETFNLYYDERERCSYQASRLDLRAKPETLSKLIGWLGRKDYNAFVEEEGAESLKYVPKPDDDDAPFYDERGLHSAYGFESLACAEYPTYIMFDVVNKCNAKCIHCPQGDPVYRKQIGRGIQLEEAIYKKVLEESSKYELQLVRITADGEPFLHRKLLDIIRYADELGINTVALTSNASLMNKELADALLDTGLYIVYFSLDAIREDTYAQVRKGLKHEVCSGNINYLIEEKKRRGSALKIMISFVKQPDNENEVEEFESYWNERADNVLVRELTSNVNQLDLDRGETLQGQKRWPCPHWFRRVVINYDGMLKACPIDWENESTYRHLEQIKVYDAWPSSFYWKNRIEHLNNLISKSSLCSPCNDWLATPWDKGYEKVIHGLEEAE